MDASQILLLSMCIGNQTLNTTFKDNLSDDLQYSSMKTSRDSDTFTIGNIHDNERSREMMCLERDSGIERKRQNEKLALLGKTLKISTLRDWPLSDYKMNTTTEEYYGAGVAFRFVELLRREFGFNYTIVPTPDNSAENIMKMVTKGEVDMAAAFLPVIQRSRDKVIFSATLAKDQWVVLLRRPQESASGSSLLAPFDRTVWILILLSLSIVGPVMYAIIIIRVKLCKGNAHLTKVFPLTSCIWFVYGALMKQGSTLNPISDSSRLLFATWWIFITVVTAFYTANLTAFLTLSRFTLPISGPEDIVKKSYHWIGLRGSSIERIINDDESYGWLRQSIYTGFGQFINSSDEELIELVQNKGLMFIREKRVVIRRLFKDYMKKVEEGVEESQRCIFAVTPDPFLTLPLAFVFPIKSRLPKLFNPILSTLVEAGIVDHLLQYDLPQSEICPLDLGSKDRQLRNSDLVTTYQAVGIGLLIASVAFIVEHSVNLWSRWKYGKSKQKLFRRRIKPAVAGVCSVYPWFTGKQTNNLDSNGIYDHSKYIKNDSENRSLRNDDLMCEELGVNLNSYNGREYIKVEGDILGSSVRLIPIRAPSAVLFDKGFREQNVNLQNVGEKKRTQKLIRKTFME